jgi:hypothetical protein
MTDQHALSVYLNDHLAGATGGLELFRRAAASHPGARGEELARLRDEVEEDRNALKALMHRLGVEENRPMAAIGWVGEKAGRLKPNGYLVRRSPLADVVELEALRVGVHGKLCGWQVLRVVARHDNRVTLEEVETLIERAEDQQARLYKLHIQAADDQLAERD